MRERDWKQVLICIHEFAILGLGSDYTEPEQALAMTENLEFHPSLVMHHYTKMTIHALFCCWWSLENLQQAHIAHKQKGGNP